MRETPLSVTIARFLHVIDAALAQAEHTTLAAADVGELRATAKVLHNLINRNDSHQITFQAIGVS